MTGSLSTETQTETETETETETDALARFIEIVHIANDHDVERELVAGVLDRLERFGFAAHVVVRTFSSDGSALLPLRRAVADAGPARDFLSSQVIPVVGSFEGAAVTENQIIAVDDHHSPDIPFHQGYRDICLRARDMGVLSGYMFPLVATEPIGTLTFYGFVDDAFDMRSLELASRAARVLASGMEKCRLLASSEAKRTELLRANAMLEASNRDLQDFAYVASHDLQEPLRKIQTFGDRLEAKASDRLTADQLSYLDRMSAASEQIQNLINDLLRFSRANTRGGEPASVELSAAVEEARSNCDGLLTALDADVTIGELPAVEGDHELFVEVFETLFANSIKYAQPDGRLTISVEIDPRAVGTEIVGEGGGAAGAEDANADEEREQLVTVVYRDDGIGFDPKYNERIFQPFYRLHSQQEYEGSGIGLAVCRRIVNRYDATIRAAGSPGGGAVFTLQFRVPSITEPQSPAPPPDSSAE